MLDLLAAIVRAGEIDPRRVAINLRRSCVTITELADTLVRLEGLSVRQAHKIAAVGAAFTESTGRVPAIDAEAFKAIVSAENFVAVRDARPQRQRNWIEKLPNLRKVHDGKH